MNNRIPILISLFLLTACDSDLKTEYNINTISFPPKLAVSATLDGGSGIFKLLLSEGNSLADYAEPRSENKNIIRDGEIRLFEDNQLIFSEPGPFDLSFVGYHVIIDENGQSPIRYGYRYEKSGISTRPGSVYRLEIEVDGYKTVTSSMTMPVVPVVVASMDTAVQVRMMITPQGDNLLPQYRKWDIHPGYDGKGFWPVSVHLTDPDPNERNYFVLEIYRRYNCINCNEFMNINIIPDHTESEIYVSDISILQDNPNIEAFEGGVKETNHAALYQFYPLYMSDIIFPGKSASLTFYSPVERTTSDQWWDNPYYTEPHVFVKILFHHTTILHIRHISAETFKYYRGQLLQNAGFGYYTEPVTIAGNVENGYGSFAVYNTTSIQLLEWESYEYRKK